MTDYTSYAPTATEPAARPKRSTQTIVLAAAAVFMLLVAAVLAFSLVKTSTRANHAESLASSRAKQIEAIEVSRDGLRTQLTQAQQQFNAETTRADKAEAQVTAWRNAGAADEAFWGTVTKSSPAVTLAGKDLTISLGHTMCRAESSGMSRAEVIAKNTYFPVDQITAVVDAAETFLC